MKLICILITLVLVAPFVNAQKVVQLKNDKTGRVILLKKGKRVRCVSLGGVKTGRLQDITPETITIGNEVIEIRKIGAIGKRMRGTNALAFLTVFMGTSAIIENFDDSNSGIPNCPSCSSSPTIHTASEDVLAIFFGAALIGTGVWLETANSPRSMGKWTLTVVDSKR